MSTEDHPLYGAINAALKATNEAGHRYITHISMTVALEAADRHMKMEIEGAIAAVLRHCEAREKIAADNGLIAIAYTSDIRAAIESAK